MADYSSPRPSSQPLQSTDLEVLKDNLITMDRVINSPSGTPIANRVGETITPLIDIIDSANSLITQAISTAGYLIVGDFGDAVKVEITSPNEVYTSKSVAGSEDALWRTNQTAPYTPTGSDPTSGVEFGRWQAVAIGNLKSIARSLNVDDENVIYSTDTTTLLNDVLYIYNIATQRTLKLPDNVADGQRIVSIDDYELTTNGNVYTMTDLDHGADLTVIARSLNTSDGSVIYSTDTTTELNDVIYIYDSASETTYKKPFLTGSSSTIASVTGSVLVTSNPTATFAMQKVYERDYVDAKRDFGSPCNGVDYDDEYVQLALDEAVAKKIPLKLSSGQWRFKAPTAESTAALLFPESSDLDIEVFGDGDSTVINMDDNIDHGFLYCALFGNTAGLTIALDDPIRAGYGKVYIHSMKFVGAWTTEYNHPTNGKFGRNLFGFSKLDHFKVKYTRAENLQTKWSRGGFHKKYTAMFNEVDVCASDVFRAQESENVTISFNTVNNADDDSIAVHSEKTTGEPNSAATILIEGNVISDSESILCLGGKIVNISNNIISRSHGTCLAVLSFPSFSEGQSPSHTVKIQGNIITDPMTRATDGTFAVTDSTQSAIQIGRSFVTPDSSGDVPARPKASDSTFYPPYGVADGVNFMYANDMYSQPSSGGSGVDVSNNTIKRTLPSNVAYSANGYGKYIDRYGESDPTIADTCFMYAGIGVINDINGLNISNNIISSMYYNGIRFRRVDNVNDTWELGINNATISGNTITDCHQGISSNMSESTSSFNWSINIFGNTIDCDPWHKAPGRNADGSWTESTAISTLCTGILLRQIQGVSIDNNIFKNCYQPIKTSQVDGLANITYSGSGNKVYCDPVSHAYNVGNKGIGNIGYGSEFTHIIYDATPSSATFGKIITNPSRTWPVKPTSGTYVKGFRVDNALITAVPCTFAWVRATTGSSHVSGVDWIPLIQS